MTKLQILITTVFIGIFALLFFFLQKNNSISSNTPPAAVTPTFSPILTGTFQAEVNLTPQAGENGQQMGPQAPAGKQNAAANVGPLSASIAATIKTSKGDIELTLYGDKAPNTVRNFMTKAQSGFYKNLIFHRVEGWVIQGGDPKGNGTGGGQMLTEPNAEPFVVGSLGVARGGDPRISNDAQFFITKEDSPHLNEQYTNFGIVTKGIDIVEKIAIGDKILGISIKE